jgi:hypothetical protein
MLRSRLVWWALLVITAVAVAFWMAFVAAAAVVIATIGTEAAEADPDRVTSIAVPLAVLASVVAVVAVAVIVRARQRSRIRQFVIREPSGRSASDGGSTTGSGTGWTTSPSLPE